MAPPLLNEYKLPFALNRIAKTVSGGPGLAPRGTRLATAICVVIFSLLFFLLPAIGSYFINQMWTVSLLSSLVFGGGFSVLHLITYGIAWGYQKDAVRTLSDQESQRFLQGEASLEGNPFAAAFKYLFVKEQAVVSGAFLGLASHVLTLQLGTSNAVLSNGIFYALAWLAVCMCHWPLLCKKPAEPNTYHTEDVAAIDDYSRLIHVLLPLALLALEGSIPALQYIHDGLLWILVLLPIVWAAGFAPTARILSEMGLERLNTVLFGCSPTTNNLQLSIMLMLNLVVSAVLVLLFFYQLPFAGLLAAAGLSTILGSRLIALHIVAKSLRVSTAHILGTDPAACRNTSPQVLLPLRLCVAVGLGVLIWMMDSTSARHPWASFLQYGVIALTLLVKATRELQQVRIPSLLPLLLNPLALHSDSLVSKGLGLLHSFSATVLFYGVHTYIFCSSIATTFSFFADPSSRLLDVWKVLMIARAFNISARSVEPTGVAVCLVVAIQQWTAFQTSSFGSWWGALDFGTMLFLSHLAKNCILRLLRKTAFWVLSLTHFLTHKKERHPTWSLWMAPILVVSPLTIVIASVLDAPCMPFLGLPLFIVSFPRPKRFWEPIANEYATGRDVPLYMSMAPTLLCKLSEAIRLGRYPPIHAGTMFLARFESRIMVIRGIEAWFEGSIATITATELEPTSCHALEGTVVDEVLDKTLDSDQRTWTNQHLLNTLQPLGSLTVSGYVESETVTTGILTNNSFTTSFPPLFFKVLAFYFFKRMDLQQMLAFRGSPVNSTIATQIKTVFPTLWFELVKQNSPKYQAALKSMNIGRLAELNETITGVIQTAFIVMLGASLSSAGSLV
ncbi:Pecanex-like protein 4 [Kappamyces sp. JEL0680]|nr:Pecanex-like protein 4 [Kappamyces sp. JEL0680]